MCVFVDACGLLCLPLPPNVNVDSSIFSQLIIQSVCRLCFHLSHLGERTPRNYTHHQNRTLTPHGLQHGWEWRAGREGEEEEMVGGSEGWGEREGREEIEGQEGKDWRVHRRQEGYTVERGVSATAVNPLQGLVSCQTS